MRAASLAIAVALTLLPGSAPAQEDDRDYLTAFLEDNLSGDNQKVTITGFEGALSSRATMSRLQIADADGVWLTLDDVVLDWSRSSLLSGELEVNELSAATITLDRLPAPATDTTPAPEAGSFALPDLPVSVVISKVDAPRIILGPSLLGEPVEGRFEASLSLISGTGKASVVLERTDGPVSRITLDAGYENASTQLTLDLHATEQAGGIAARMLGLPGTPSVDLAITGAGPLDDFAADVQLASDGVDRLAGKVTLRGGEEGATDFAADLSGDLAPLFLPDYAAFLGDKVVLTLAGSRAAGGRVALDQLQLAARALDLNGSALIAGDGLPLALDLTIRIGTPDGLPVLLPLTSDTRLRTADLTLRFDAAKDSAWSLKGLLSGLQRPDLTLDQAQLTGSGRISRTAGRNTLGGTFGLQAEGLALADMALQQAIGPALSAKAVLYWREGDTSLSLPQLTLTGADYSATAHLRIGGLDSALQTSGKATITAADLRRFAAVAGLPSLAGVATIAMEGEGSTLTGAFDLALALDSTSLRIGISQADRLLSGPARLTGAARRDETGTTLRALDLTAKSLTMSASGKLATVGSNLTGQVTLGTLTDLDPAYGGGLSADLRFDGTPQNGTLTLTGNGHSLSIGQTEVDRLIAGQTTLDLALTLRDGALLLQSGQLDGPNLTAEARGNGDLGELQVTGRIRDLALLAPGYPGPVTLSGRVTPGTDRTALDLRILGPAAIDASIKGQLVGTTADLTLRGTADAAVLNALADPATLAGTLSMDLALRGPFSPTSLSGRVTLSGGRLAYPYRGVSLTRTELLADLANGRVQLSATSELTNGGRLRLGGAVGMAPPFDAALDLTLDQIHLRDPELFDTTGSGQLRITGPLLGRALLAGRILFGETSLQVPATGFASAADLEAITHVGDTAAVRTTRTRAGLDGNGTSGPAGERATGPDWALNVTIDAPNRIFLRGRGLDAELGGQITLGGTLQAVIPTGAIQLIRGRLDLLGKRLTLSKADLALEGDLVPTLSISASNETDGVTTYLNIDGPANAPEVTFSSTPELPQEEVLAYLLFGRGLETISVLQAAELANAVAVLAGRGGEGIVAKLRRSIGVDDLDINTAADGTASVGAGKYLSDNLYTGVTIDQNGQSRVTLNLDLRQGVTVKGRVGSDGQTGIGVFLERDY